MTPLTDAEAAADRGWFADNPTRRYRARRQARGWWIIRRRDRDTMLRTHTKMLPVADNDNALRSVWFAAAWPEIGPSLRAELIKRAKGTRS